MHWYRIRFRESVAAESVIVDADEVCGLKPEYDTYWLELSGNVVAAAPKEAVACIERLGDRR
ncbi:MAG: hypothetical protein OXI50_06595 [Gammaproteobacteria bacterium]|nr:hypothetical protein [Gammaproteobacteria bacterium]